MGEVKKTNKNVESIIKRALERGLTHGAIAKICSVSVGTVYRWKKGGIPKPNVIARLENHLKSTDKNWRPELEEDKGEIIESTILATTIKYILKTEKSEVLTNIIRHKLLKFNEEILTLGEAYYPKNNEELKLLISNLFSPNLRKLRSTSIHSKYKNLGVFDSFWDKYGIGRHFSEQNKIWMRFRGKGNIERVFLCDSLADVITEDFFKDLVLKQVEAGIDVKIHQMDKSITDTYEDFSIYDNEVDGINYRYVLSAPQELITSEGVQTKLITEHFNYDTVEYFIHKFKTYYESPYPPIRIFKSVDKKIEYYTGDKLKGRISDNFNTAILRDLRILKFDESSLKVKESLLTKYIQYVDQKNGFVRKFEKDYSRVIFNMILDYYPNVENIIYFGDTADNDGGVIRNLQILCEEYKDSRIKEISGFICEPALELDNIWFNFIYYSTKWSDVISYLNLVKDIIDEHKTLAIFDIDQTLWSPKGDASIGGHEQPLREAREAAMKDIIIKRYILEHKKDYAEHIVASAKQIYKLLSGMHFNKLTEDNESYKVAISIFMALGFCKEKSIYNHSGEIVRFSSDNEIVEILTQYLSDEYRKGILSFMNDVLLTLSSVPNLETSLEAEGINIIVREDIVKIIRRIKSKQDTIFPEFRDREFEQTMERSDITKSKYPSLNITLNKAIWDLASILKDKGMNLLLLSDRPYQSTYREERPEVNLFNREMFIRGYILSDDLKNLLK